MAGPKLPKKKVLTRAELEQAYEDASAKVPPPAPAVAAAKGPPMRDDEEEGEEVVAEDKSQQQEPAVEATEVGGAPAVEVEELSDEVQELLVRLPQGKDKQEERLAAFKAMSPEDLALLVFGLDRYCEYMARQWALASRVIWQLLIVALEITGGKMPIVTAESDVKTVPGPAVPFRAQRPGAGRSKLAIANSADVDKALDQARKRRGVGPRMP